MHCDPEHPQAGTVMGPGTECALQHQRANNEGDKTWNHSGIVKTTDWDLGAINSATNFLNKRERTIYLSGPQLPWQTQGKCIK